MNFSSIVLSGNQIAFKCKSMFVELKHVLTTLPKETKSLSVLQKNIYISTGHLLAKSADVRLIFQTQFSPPIFLYMLAAT